MFKLSDGTKKVIEELNKQGYKGYLVGGCVRDFSMGLEPGDIDITTDATPDEIERIFSDYRTIETGIKHGTVTVLVGDESFEITTFRIESTYSDNRHPDKVTFTNNLQEDLSRRDFTMNAIAYNEKEGLIDYFNGITDIKEKRIRCVGVPDKRFNEDALRILRALRFSSVTGFDIESETKKALFKNRELLKNISAERVYTEITKLLCGKNVKDILIRYIDIIGVNVPELLHMKNFEQKNPHHSYDVLTHTAIVTESIESIAHLRYAALFHDIGKPHTFSVDEDGIGHFYSHAKESVIMAEKILRRLKADNATIETVTELIRHHDSPVDVNDTVIKRKLNKLGAELFFDLIKLMKADNLGQHPDYIYRQEKYAEIERIANEILSRKECFSLADLEIKGNDIIDLGVKPGKVIGEVLSMLLDMVIEGKIQNEKAALIENARLLIYKE